jgi:chitin synthase
MFTSSAQYFALLPSYICTLQVYAFCNTHDITWGTKGDTKPEKLGGIKAGSDGKFKVDLPTDEADLNTQYEKELNEFARPYKPPKKDPSDEDKQEDYYKGFRSVVVLAWMFTNLALCSVVLQTGGMQVIINPDKTAAEQTSDQNAKIYLSVVLWSVAGLSAFRFLGAMWFLIVRLVSALPCCPSGWLTVTVPRHLSRGLILRRAPARETLSLIISTCCILFLPGICWRIVYNHTVVRHRSSRGVHRLLPTTG